MLSFDPTDPFPLLPASRHDYRAEQVHAAQADTWLGLQPALIESSVKGLPEQQNWADLPIQALMTPYTELRFLLEELGLRPGETIVDLGAAYGRMAFVMARHFPESRFVGFELEPARVAEGQRCLRQFLAGGGAGNARALAELLVADLESTEFVMPVAEYYFIYDYGTRQAILKTLDQLRAVSGTRAICVVGRGRRVRDLIERGQPWLSQVVEPSHYAHFSIYRSHE